MFASMPVAMMAAPMMSVAAMPSPMMNAGSKCYAAAQKG